MANRAKSIPACIGENIRRFRLQVSLTQKELAEKLYRSESAVRMWELGKSEPDGDTLVNMANIFHVSVDNILGKDQSPAARPTENTVILYGRDGNKTDRTLTEEQYKLILGLLGQMSDEKK